jgi:single-stranded DNA-binding protein
LSTSALIAGKQCPVANIREGVGEEATWWSVTAFAEAADDLLKLEAGDAISISGPFTAEVYAKDDTPPRVSFRIIVDRIASPRLGKRKEAAW